MKRITLLLLFIAVLANLAAQEKEFITTEIKQQVNYYDSLARNYPEQYAELYPEVLAFYKKNQLWEDYFGTYYDFIFMQFYEKMNNLK